ncbi:MAG TPA: ATP/GTP-binding protein [Opitutaceae bacterium]|nr:ATP/GTP-binding protein [Opitutaceae bacterium]
MKPPALLVFLALATSLAAAPKLTKKWETEASLKVPESVLYDGARGVLYVTNIDGAPWEDDAKGSVGKVGLDGKILQAEWITGLSAPKGMALHGNRLYIGDIDRVVVVDVDRGQVVERIAVAGAHGLNDVAADRHGVVYVSDSRDKKIYALRDGRASVLLEGLRAPNGVHVRDDQLFFMDNGSLYRLAPGGEKVLVSAGKEGNGDGLEYVGGEGFIITYWPGQHDYAKTDGSRTTLLDTSAEKANAADIGYNPKDRIVYVPTFFRNTVIAYAIE